MSYRERQHLIPVLRTALGMVLCSAAATSAQAAIDGHGPDAWRVTGVAGADRLSAHMGPGSDYPVIETFAPDERGMQQITCVPLYTAAHYAALTPAQINALPPRWCLMRNASMSKAGWVAQRFITPDERPVQAERSPALDAPASAGDPLIAEAEAIVRDLYAAEARAEQGRGESPLQGEPAAGYFTTDIVAPLQSGGFGAHPLYGAQDFDGSITAIAPDRDQPMFRGMITINVDFINFGEPQRAVYLLRADTTQEGAPLRIFRVEHEGWSYP